LLPKIKIKNAETKFDTLSKTKVFFTVKEHIFQFFCLYNFFTFHFHPFSFCNFYFTPKLYIFLVFELEWGEEKSSNRSKWERKFMVEQILTSNKSILVLTSSI
jgi:hypothetical protein